ncbi:MAG TPA: hypothetical protein DCE41_27565 [Cytophagales bacterium]|nr:hypothetical protein [Cytophagales bacterium]HAA24017.1 hypothetical protein [Cytophagales bacterium]HAP61538.1 hypothetical protein [Cytophagales bacterium]
MKTYLTFLLLSVSGGLFAQVDVPIGNSVNAPSQYPTQHHSLSDGQRSLRTGKVEGNPFLMDSWQRMGFTFTFQQERQEVAEAKYSVYHNAFVMVLNGEEKQLDGDLVVEFTLFPKTDSARRFVNTHHFLDEPLSEGQFAEILWEGPVSLVRGYYTLVYPTNREVFDSETSQIYRIEELKLDQRFYLVSKQRALPVKKWQHLAKRFKTLTGKSVDFMEIASAQGINIEDSADWAPLVAIANQQ